MATKAKKPRRIVRRRTKDWKLPNTIYVGRPTVWGNPFVVGSELIGGGRLTPEKAVALYRQYARDNFNLRDLRACLRGRISLAGVHFRPCHADVLLELANGQRVKEIMLTFEANVQRPTSNVQLL